ncbi:DUF4192 domain-containing protein [Nocardioides pelophilus]|uniref:DUF4192 domain-containing protein n=1 Tax=Nocardioides pelophilus TaxID=2172019 RepID=UPI00160035F3|nr:DUF4192 domain-containing protein [Nocardioides pelophilus]
MTSMLPGSGPEPSLDLRVRCTEDLLAAAPLVLGFQPTDSVVMLTSDGDRPFHARVDLPSRSEPAAAATAVADSLLGPAQRNNVSSLALLFFSDDQRAVRRAWGALRRGSERARIRVVEAVRADGCRYYPLVGDQRLREIGVAYDVSSHPFAAHAVMHGIVVEKDRAALVASVAPDRAAQRVVEETIERLGLDLGAPPRRGVDRRRWGEWLQRVVAGHVARGTVATDEELARAGWVAQDLRVRDAAWALIRRSDAGRHQAFWLDAARRMPDPIAAAPAALLGWAAWQAGHGALAWIAVDRCAAVAPGYGMAGILRHCLESAVPPDSLDESFAWDEGLPA